MNSRRLFYLLVAALILVNGAGIAALVLGDKQLVKQNTKLTELKVQSSSLETVQSSLVQAKKDIETYSVLEQITKSVIPQEKDQARTVREIVKLAGEAGVPVSSVSFPSSTLGSKSVAGATGASTTAGTTTQTQKVTGINNVERLEITVTSDPSKPVLYSDFIKFLSKLEQNRRTSQVASINIQPVADNRNKLTFSLVLNVYIEK